MDRKPGKALLLVGLGFLAGLAIRLFQLDVQTFTHPEFYVPALDVADFVTSPRARFTVPDVLYEALVHDKHPPGYYLMMLGWNLNVGTEVFQIRLSSVLFGMAGLIAIPWYVRVNRGSGFGALAVWLLAMHGFHMFWSQQARPWALIGTVGIITTAMLVSVVRRPRILMMIGYGLLAGFGMWIDYYFWPFFCAQVLWVVLHELDRKHAPLAISGVALAAIVATPMLTYFYLHFTEQPSHLPPAGLEDPLRFVQFGGVLMRGRVKAGMGAFAIPFEILVTILGATALVLGLRPWRGSGQQETDTAAHRPGVVFAVLGVFAILLTAWTWIALHGIAGDRKIFWGSLLGPFIVLSGWGLVSTLWRTAAQALARLGFLRPVRRIMRDAVTVVPLAAFGAVMVVTLVKPLLAWYAMVGFTPFVVVIAARGLERLQRWRVPLVAAVVAVFAASIWEYRTRPFSPIEYKGLGLQLAELVTPGQAIVMRNDWSTQPLNYYLPHERYRVVPISHLPDVEPPLDVELPDTVWLVAVGDDESMLDERLAFAQRFVPNCIPIRRISTGTSAALEIVRVRPAVDSTAAVRRVPG